MSVIFLLITGLLSIAGLALSLRAPNAMQLFFILLIPVQSIAGVYMEGNSLWAEGLLYGFIAGALLRYAITKKQLPIMAWPWWSMLIVFILSGTVATIVNEMNLSVLGAWKTHIIVPAALFLAITLYPKKNIRSQLRGIILVVISVSVMAIIQYFVTELRVEPWNGIQEEFRATSIFTHPNYFAMFLGPLIAYLVILSFQVFHKANNWKKGVLLLFVAAVGIIALVLSKSTGAICALSVTLLLFTAIAIVRSKKTNMMIAGSVGLVMILLLCTTIPTLTKRIEQTILLKENSGQIRKEVWSGAWQLVQEHPIKGVGLQCFEQEYHKIQPLSHTVRHPYPHNVFLAFWLETTLFGLLFLVAILCYAINTLWRCRHHQYALPLLSAVIVIVIHGLIDTPYFHPSLSLLFWYIMAQTVIVQQQSVQLLKKTTNKKKKQKNN